MNKLFGPNIPNKVNGKNDNNTNNIPDRYKQKVLLKVFRYFCASLTILYSIKGLSQKFECIWQTHRITK